MRGDGIGDKAASGIGVEMIFVGTSQRMWVSKREREMREGG